MTTAIDTNVLLDVLIPESTHNRASRLALADVNAAGGLIIGEAVVAELSAHFDDPISLWRFVEGTRLRHVPSSRECLELAGAAWRQYNQRRRSGIECPQCGTSQTLSCTNCGRGLSPRQHVLADFLIGAHAQVHADRLLTRDRGYYQTYFPELLLG